LVFRGGRIRELLELNNFFTGWDGGKINVSASRRDTFQEVRFHFSARWIKNGGGRQHAPWCFKGTSSVGTWSFLGEERAAV